MAIEAKVKRVEQDDPRRCQAMAGNNQCPYGSDDGSQYCVLHSGAAMHRKAIQKKEIDQYRVGIFRERLKELSDHPKIKGLRDEVSILKMTLETVLERCQSTADLYLQHGKIAELCTKIEKLVVSCNAIEHKNGQMLDKTELLKMVDAILGILTKYIEDPEALRGISDEVFGLFSES